MRTHGICRATLIFAVASALVAVPARAVDWPNYRGVNHDGKTTETVPSWPPVESWSVDIGAGFSSVAVVGGYVYTEGWSDGQNTVWCLDESDGSVVWSFSYACSYADSGYRGSRATPTVHNGFVYTFSQDGHLYRFNATTGAETLIDTISSGEPGWGFASSPLIEGNLVIVNAYGNAGVAYDLTSLSKVWPASASNGAGHASPVAFTWNAQRYVAIFAGSRLAGVDPSNGTVLFTYPWAGTSTNAADPIPSGDTIFISTGYGQGCEMLNLGSGTLTSAWYKGGAEAADGVRLKENCAVLDGGHLYGVNDGGTLRCVAWSDGITAWSRSGFGTEGSVILTGSGLLVVSNTSNQLAWVEASAAAYNELGARLSTGMSGNMYTSAVLSNGQIYLRGNASPGILKCYTFFVDSDSDGIDDIWEVTYFGDLTTADGTSDTDGDGTSDLQEYQDGTNPLVDEGASDGDAAGLSCVAGGGGAVSLGLLVLVGLVALLQAPKHP